MYLNVSDQSLLILVLFRFIFQTFHFGGNLSLNQLWLKLSLHTGLKITAGQWPDKMTIRNIFDRTFLNFWRMFDRSSAYFGWSLSIERPLFWALKYIVLRRVNLTSRENGSAYLRVIIIVICTSYILYFI